MARGPTETRPERAVSVRVYSLCGRGAERKPAGCLCTNSIQIFKSVHQQKSCKRKRSAPHLPIFHTALSPPARTWRKQTVGVPANTSRPVPAGGRARRAPQ